MNKVNAGSHVLAGTDIPLVKADLIQMTWLKQNLTLVKLYIGDAEIRLNSYLNIKVKLSCFQMQIGRGA